MQMGIEDGRAAKMKAHDASVAACVIFCRGADNSAGSNVILSCRCEGVSWT